MKTLVEEDAHSQISGPGAFGIENGELYYVVQPRRQRFNRGDSGPGGGVATGVGVSFLGRYLAPRQPLTTVGTSSAQREVLPEAPLPVRETRIRAISLHGGLPMDRVTLRGERFCLVGSHLFWIRPGPEQTVHVTRGGISWNEVTAHSDLMLTSLAENTTRCIRSGFPRQAAFVPGEAGVTWEEPARFPEKPGLFYASISDGSVRSLGNCAEDQTPEPVVEYEGRLYWTVSRYGTPPGGDFDCSHSVVMSADRSGGDVRTLLTRVGRHVAAAMSLHAYRGGLYCRFTETAAAASDRFKDRLRLARLFPERSDPVEIFHSLPNGIVSYQFDGGYLYFVTREEKRSFWSALTASDECADCTYTLCRLPLAP
jgi:hypothetical protein